MLAAGAFPQNEADSARDGEIRVVPPARPGCFIEGAAKNPPYLEVLALPAALLAARLQFAEPPVPSAAHATR